MPLEVHSIPRPDWAPLPRDGCRGVEVKVLLEDDHLLVAMLRFRLDGTIDEHPSHFDGDLVCLDGPGKQHESQLRAGDWRTLVTLWNTAVTGVFRAPAGALGKLLG